MGTFREAVEAKDLKAIEELLADDVVFRSPVVFKPYPGKGVTLAILRTVIEIFKDFHYVRDISDGDQHALVFEAKVDGLAITGCDFLTHDADGRIVDFMVMTRPLKATQALADAVGARFPEIEAAAVAWMEQNAS